MAGSLAPGMHWAVRTTLCSALRSEAEHLPYQAVMQPVRMLFSGLAPPLGLCRGGDLCGLYSASFQDGTLVVGDIPLVVWGLCFGKVGGVISCLFGPVGWGHSVS